VSDFIYGKMKDIYRDMSYLKMSVLVPKRKLYLIILDTIGFIIGIDGKNINDIRDNSGARIEVFQDNINHKYRQIEVAGSFLLKIRKINSNI
jgi:hypothetical protein